ncbi:MAG TPA: universal stress protein [Symbiobacteriaceae bacterium]|nr:universal stress protein [Symbiobacteriaceae bacterium]
MKRALLATDASEASLRAAKALGRMARHDPEMYVTILHVVPLPDVVTPAAAAGAPLTLPGRLEDYLENRTREVLETTTDMLDLPAERVKTMHVIGNAADAILGEAKTGRYDLIVMGRRGLSPLREMLLGSVSQAVIHRAHCPIFLVP